LKLPGCRRSSSPAEVVHRTRWPKNFPQHDSCTHPVERAKHWLPYYLGRRADTYRFVRRFDQGRLGNVWRWRTPCLLLSNPTAGLVYINRRARRRHDHCRPGHRRFAPLVRRNGDRFLCP